MFLELLAENWVKLFFTLLSTGILAYCGFLHNKVQSYKRMVEDKDQENLEELIEAHIKPLKEKSECTEAKFNAIKDSYRYRLISLCERYLDRGFLTPKEYSALSEMWKVYHDLGGNSQAEDYYHKVVQLPVHDDHKPYQE